MKQAISLCVMLLLSVAAAAQSSTPYANPYFKDSSNRFTTKQQRLQHRQYLVDSVIKKGLQQPLSMQGLPGWHGAFWAMELLLYKDAFVKQKLAEAWQAAATLPEAFQKALLEASYTLYPQDFQPAANSLLQQTKSPAVFVRCAEYLLQMSAAREQKLHIRQQLHQKFNYEDHPALSVLYKRLHAPPPVYTTALLRAVFGASFLPGKTVVYSVQRGNRNHAGLVLIRKADGNFLHNDSGTLFTASQLARSISHYPYYITNGNTPQGIFRWTGFGQSDNNYIGPTTNLQLVMPFEATPAVFFADSSITGLWTKEWYARLLPANWQQYPALWQAYEAGAAGRSEIIMHGTAIDPKFYQGQTYFPQTPSLGCLCSYEEWNSEGKLVRSEQQKIVEALQKTGATEGYVVVIDIDNQLKPVTLQQVRPLLPK